jgi:hypothetical protein
VLLRLGLAVMAALQEGLLELDDFEALITHLKVRCGRRCSCMLAIADTLAIAAMLAVAGVG